MATEKKRIIQIKRAAAFKIGLHIIYELVHLVCMKIRQLAFLRTMQQVIETVKHNNKS